MCVVCTCFALSICQLDIITLSQYIIMDLTDASFLSLRLCSTQMISVCVLCYTKFP